MKHLALIVILLASSSMPTQSAKYNREVGLRVYADHITVLLSSYIGDETTFNRIRETFNSSSVQSHLSNLLYPLQLRNFGYDFKVSERIMIFRFDIYGIVKRVESIEHGWWIFKWHGGNKYYTSIDFLSLIKISFIYSSGAVEIKATFDYSFAGQDLNMWRKADEGRFEFVTGNDFAEIHVEKIWWQFWISKSLKQVSSDELVYIEEWWP